VRGGPEAPLSKFTPSLKQVKKRAGKFTEFERGLGGEYLDTTKLQIVLI